MYYGPFCEGDTKAITRRELPHELRLLFIQIENFFYNEVLDMEFAKENPETVYEALEAVLYKHAKYANVSFEDAMG
jgi:hypothetical protein